MKEKYLPIGTVCTIKNSNDKTIIIGYNVNNNDYKGTEYPDGIGATYFNHTDIEEIVFNGFKDSEFDKFNLELNKQSSEVITTTKKGEFQFDENGVVIFDPNDVQNVEEETEEKAEVVNPFTTINEQQSNKETKNIFDNIKFDENGVVIEDNTVVSDKPMYVFDENGFIIEDNSAQAQPQEIESNVKFDENGMVIE